MGLAIVLLGVVQAAHKGHSRAVRNRGCLLGWPARRGKGRNCNRSGGECEGAAGAGAGGGAELGRVLAGPASRSDLPPARQGPGGVYPQAREAESAGGQAWGLGHDCRAGVLGAPGDPGAEHPNTEKEVRAQPGAGRGLRGAACASLTVAPTSSAPRAPRSSRRLYPGGSFVTAPSPPPRAESPPPTPGLATRAASGRGARPPRRGI